MLFIWGPFYQTSYEPRKFYVNIVRTRFLRKELRPFYQRLRTNIFLRWNKMFVRNSYDRILSDKTSQTADVILPRSCQINLRTLLGWNIRLISDQHEDFIIL